MRSRSIAKRSVLRKPDADIIGIRDGRAKPFVFWTVRKSIILLIIYASCMNRRYGGTDHKVWLPRDRGLGSTGLAGIPPGRRSLLRLCDGLTSRFGTVIYHAPNSFPRKNDRSFRKAHGDRARANLRQIIIVRGQRDHSRELRGFFCERCSRQADRRYRVEDIRADGSHGRWRVDGREVRTGLKGAGGYGGAALADGRFSGSCWDSK